MAKAKTPRVSKPRASKNILQMPDTGLTGNTNGNGNGNGNGHGFTPVELETEIRVRAYELFEQRGSVPGSETDDWFAAEREILARAKPLANAK